MRIAGFFLVVAISTSLSAQAPVDKQHFGICKPVAERQNNADGCWIVTDSDVGKMAASEMYWHLDTFPSEASAQQAKTEGGTVIHALDKWWLLTISKKDWNSPRGSNHVADIGPLPVNKGQQYSALYMETVMDPGTKSAIHRHSGPEAWYTQTGATCLETDSGKFVETPGSAPVIVPEGAMMELTAVGREKRRGLTLILHRAAEAPTTMVHEWKPKGLCLQP